MPKGCVYLGYKEYKVNLFKKGLVLKVKSYCRVAKAKEPPRKSTANENNEPAKYKARRTSNRNNCF